MPVLTTTSHKLPPGGDAVMEKRPTSVEDFPPDVQEFLYELFAKAITRAINNGTYVPPVEQEPAEES